MSNKEEFWKALTEPSVKKCDNCVFERRNRKWKSGGCSIGATTNCHTYVWNNFGVKGLNDSWVWDGT